MGEKRTSNELVAGANAIDAKAAEWVARLDRFEPAARDCVELDAWSGAGSPSQRRVLARAGGLDNLDRVGILRSGGVHPDLETLSGPLSRRAMLRKVAATGSVGIAVAAVATMDSCEPAEIRS